MKAIRIAVDDTGPVLIADEGDHIGPFAACVENRGASSVFVGASDVSATTGFEVVSGDSFDFSPPDGSGEKLYAICAAGQTASVQVIHTGS